MVLLGGVSSIGDARRERDGVLRIVSRGVPRSRRLEITEACQHGAQASSNDPWSLCAIPTRSFGQHTQDALMCGLERGFYRVYADLPAMPSDQWRVPSTTYLPWAARPAGLSRPALPSGAAKEQRDSALGAARISTNSTTRPTPGVVDAPGRSNQAARASTARRQPSSPI